MNSLVSFAPPNHFENLANADVSWVAGERGVVVGCAESWTQCLGSYEPACPRQRGTPLGP